MTMRWGPIGASAIARQFMIAAIRNFPHGAVSAAMSSSHARAAEAALAFANSGRTVASDPRRPGAAA